MSEARIDHAARLDASPAELTALARIYRRAVERYQESRAAMDPGDEFAGGEEVSRVRPEADATADATDAGSHATGGDTADLDATCKATEIPLSYADSAEGGNSGIRDGDPQGAEPVNHDGDPLDRDGRDAGKNYNPHERDVEDGRNGYGAARVMGSKDGASERPWPYHEVGCPCDECSSRWPRRSAEESNLETETCSVPWYVHPLACACSDYEKYGR